ncbi:hypothetical protein D3C71_1393000 [compost metagenome]
MKAQLIHAALQFARGGFRVLHRQRGESAEARGVALDLLGQHIVGSLRDFDSTLRIGNALHGRRIEREDRELRAPLVHLREALLLEIEQVALQALPHLGAGVDLRVGNREVDREMLFERNLVLHGRGYSGLMLSLSSTSCQVLRSSAM